MLGYCTRLISYCCHLSATSLLYFLLTALKPNGFRFHVDVLLSSVGIHRLLNDSQSDGGMSSRVRLLLVSWWFAVMEMKWMTQQSETLSSLALLSNGERFMNTLPVSFCLSLRVCACVCAGTREKLREFPLKLMQQECWQSQQWRSSVSVFSHSLGHPGLNILFTR